VAGAWKGERELEKDLARRSFEYETRSAAFQGQATLHAPFLFQYSRPGSKPNVTGEPPVMEN